MRMSLLRDVLNDGGTVGQLRRIATQFSFHGPEDFLQSNIRADSRLEPLGCLGDLGWYCIRLFLWLNDWHLPNRVSGRVLAQAGPNDDVPTEFSGEMFFRDGISASFYCSFSVEHQQWAHISGTHGHVQLNDFVLPYFGSELTFESGNAVYDMVGCDFNMEPHRRSYAVAEYSNSAVQSQETNMIRHFSGNVLAQEIEPFWGRLRSRLSRHLTPVGFRRDKMASSSRWQLPEFSRVRARCLLGEYALRYAQGRAARRRPSHANRSPYGSPFSPRRVTYNSHAAGVGGVRKAGGMSEKDHFAQLAIWLEMESVAERQRLAERRQRVSTGDAEASGETLLDLVISDHQTAVGGLFLLNLVKRNRLLALPWHRLAWGLRRADGHGYGGRCRCDGCGQPA